MHSFFPLLGLLAVIPTIVSGKPVQSGKELRRLDRGIHKRQEVDGEDIETSGATDQLRKGMSLLCSLYSFSLIWMISCQLRFRLFRTKDSNLFSRLHRCRPIRCDSGGYRHPIARKQCCWVTTRCKGAGETIRGGPHCRITIRGRSVQYPIAAVCQVKDADAACTTCSLNGNLSTTGATSIPLANWNSASNACFTTIKNYAP